MQNLCMKMRLLKNILLIWKFLLPHLNKNSPLVIL